MEEPELLGKYLSRLHRYDRAYKDRELEHLGIGSGQFGFLMILFRKDGISQNALSEISNLDKTTIARSIKPLVDQGYVIRERDQDDSRSYRITLTERGRGIRPELIRIQLELEGILLSGFSEEEREVLTQLLRRMNENATRIR